MIVYGRNIILEALKSGHKIDEIKANSQTLKQFGEILKSAKKKGIRVKTVDNRELDGYTDGAFHQGVAAKIKDFEPLTFEDMLKAEPRDGPLVLLDQINDVRNFGAIARTALAAGAKGVILSQRRSAPLSPAALKVSAGAFFHLKTAYFNNLARIIDLLKKEDYWIYGADAHSKTSLFDVDFAPKTAVVFGGEEKGLRPLVKSGCDVIFKIPMAGSVESLNVSVAAAITLYEILRNK